MAAHSQQPVHGVQNHVGGGDDWGAGSHELGACSLHVLLLDDEAQVQDTLCWVSHRCLVSHTDGMAWEVCQEVGYHDRMAKLVGHIFCHNQESWVICTHHYHSQVILVEECTFWVHRTLFLGEYNFLLVVNKFLLVEHSQEWQEVAHNGVLGFHTLWVGVVCS